VHIVTQFSVFLINKPGVLAQILGALADAKINVQALTIVDSHEHGVLRLVGEPTDRIRTVLTKLNYPTHETAVIAVELSNHAGAMASVLQALAEEHINVDYAYVTAGAPGGKTTGILHANPAGRAAKVLEAKFKREDERSGPARRNQRQT
jgi:hypothetical protein